MRWCSSGGGALAEEISLNSGTAEGVEERKSELAKLRESGELTEEQKAELDQLWQDANAIQQLNDRCREISLNQALDSACTDFYKVKLPKFENDYFKLTGQIRLSGMRVKEATKDRKRMIEACYEAFPFLDLKPQNAYPMNGGVSAEPLSNGVEIEYLFSLSFGLSELWVANNEALAEFFKTWTETCRPYIFRQTDQKSFSPLFNELLLKTKENSWFEFQLSRGDMELVLSRDLWITYFVNGKPVFEVKIPKGTGFTETDSTVAKRTFEIWRTPTYVWTEYDLIMRNRVTYSDEEIEARGLKSEIRYTDYRLSEQYASWSKKQFFEENAKKEGVVTYEKWPKKFQYKIVEQGRGRQPDLGETVGLHLAQSTLYGDTLATSYGGAPSKIKFSKSSGFLYEILSKMRVGTVIRAWVPVEDFYAGKQVPSALKAETIVVLDFELVDIDESKASAFLAKNGKDENVITSEQGFQYKFTRSSESDEGVESGDVIEFMFTTSKLDGTPVLSSGKPIVAELSELHSVYREIVTQMKVGDKVKAWIPTELFKKPPEGFGEDEIMVAEIELLGVGDAEAGIQSANKAADFEPGKNHFVGFSLYLGGGDFKVKGEDPGTYGGADVGLGAFYRYYFYEWGSFQTGFNLNGIDGIGDNYGGTYNYSAVALEIPLQLRLGIPVVYATTMFTFRLLRATYGGEDDAENPDKAAFGFTGYAGFGAEITRYILIDVLFTLFDLGSKADSYTEQTSGVRVQAHFGTSFFSLFH